MYIHKQKNESNERRSWQEMTKEGNKEKTAPTGEEESCNFLGFLKDRAVTHRKVISQPDLSGPAGTECFSWAFTVDKRFKSQNQPSERDCCLVKSQHWRWCKILQQLGVRWIKMWDETWRNANRSTVTNTRLLALDYQNHFKQSYMKNFIRMSPFFT